MLYFREEEKRLLNQFVQNHSEKAMAVYGRRRTGKTALMMDFFHSHEEENLCVYYQCTSFDYALCLKDFIDVLRPLVPDSFMLDSLTSFLHIFQYLTQIHIENKIFNPYKEAFPDIIPGLRELVLKLHRKRYEADKATYEKEREEKENPKIAVFASYFLLTKSIFYQEKN